MNIDPLPADPTIGFLTVFDDPVVGMLGGLLLVDRRGRPLEFHCTAPVSVSRAEEILFGPTLRPHVYCERIGGALLAAMSKSPQLLVVNQMECWALSEESSVPLVMVDPQVAPTERSHCASEPIRAVACLDQLDPTQRPGVQRLLDELARYVELTEPFDRIAEAIREAGLLNSATDEAGMDLEGTDGVSHDQAA